MCKTRLHLCLVSLLAVLLAWSPPVATGEFELTSLDVGQGDSHLLISPEGRTLLLDSGGFPSFDRRMAPRFDIGEDVVSPYLWRRGIRRLDYVSVSHLHVDHAGGMARIIRNFRPAELWIGGVANSAVWASIQAACREHGVRVVPLRRGDSRAFGSVRVLTLAPWPEYVPSASPKNNDSLVLLFQYGRNRFLLTGDAERPIEDQLVEAGSLPEVDVLKIAHHGSRSSTTQEFLDAVRPLFALIPTGAENSYGHPHDVTVKRLFAAGVRTDRTDLEGLVTYHSNGHRIRITRYSDLQPTTSHSVTAGSRW